MEPKARDSNNNVHQNNNPNLTPSQNSYHIHSHTEFGNIKKFGIDSSTTENSYERLPYDSSILNLQADIDNLQCMDKKDHLLQKEFKNHLNKYRNKNKVLIHCSLGVSRSGSFTIVYLMKKFSLRYETVSPSNITLGSGTYKIPQRTISSNGNI